jgi:hypothetical protein
MPYLNSIIDRLRYIWHFPAVTTAFLLILPIVILILIGTRLKEPKIKKTSLIRYLLIYFFSQGLLYCVLFPPFQTPDEPGHFFELLNTNKQTNSKLIDTFIKKSHFYRIRFNYKEKFEIKHTLLQSHSNSNKSPSASRTYSITRSLLHSNLWKKYDKIFTYFNLKIEHKLLLLRVINLILSLLLLFLFFLFYPIKQHAVNNLYLFLFLPVLPFFIMMQNDYNLTPALAICYSCIIYNIFYKPQNLTDTIALIIISLALMISSKTSLLILPISFMALTIKAMYHQAYAKRFSLKKEFIHYTCASIIFLIAFYLLPLEGFLYSNINRVIKLTKIQISLIPLALISFYLIFLFIALKVIAHYKTKQKNTSAYSKKTILYCQLVIVTILIAPVFAPQENLQLANIEYVGKINPFWYLGQVLKTFIFTLGLAKLDYYLTITFFYGYGWLEFIFPFWYKLLLCKMPFFLLINFFFSNHIKQPEFKKNLLLLFLSIIYLSILAFFAGSKPVNLHGRYMLIFYIFFLFTLANSFNYDNIYTKYLPKKYKATITATAMSLLFFIINGYTIVRILERYYG